MSSRVAEEGGFKDAAYGLSKLCLFNTDFLDSVQQLALGDFTQIPVLVFFIAVVLFNFKYAELFKLPREYKQYPYTYAAFVGEILSHWIPTNLLIGMFVTMHRWLYKYFLNLDADDLPKNTFDLMKNKVVGLFSSQNEVQTNSEMPAYPFIITLAVSVYTLVAIIMNRPFA